MEINVTQQSDITILALHGRLDGISSPALEKTATDRIAAGETKLVFDCTALAYVSSAGLRAFLTAAKKAQSAAGKAVFCSLSPSIAEVFQLSGFDTLFTLHPNVAAAVADLQ